MQINQGGIFCRAAAGLIQALAVKAERGAGGGKHFCRQHQVIFFNSTSFGHQFGRVVAHCGFKGFKAGGVIADVGVVQPAFPQHDVQHAVKQRDIGAGLNR